MVTFRKAAPSDYDALGQLMFDAIHAEPSPYSLAERKAWRADPYSGSDWHQRLSDQTVFMAEDRDGPVGFLSLTPEGYVDLGYILPRGRGQGVFRSLYERLETDAKKTGLSRLSTHASLAAEGPFLAMGFDVTKRETVEIDRQSLRRSAMEKSLT